MQRFVSAWHDRCIRAEDIAAADANERLMLQRNGTTFWPSPRVLARPLETAGPRTRPEMAHAPRGKHLRAARRIQSQSICFRCAGVDPARSRQDCSLGYGRCNAGVK